MPSNDATPAETPAQKAKRFRVVVDAAGYTLAALAAATGVRLTTVRAWSRGQYPIPDARLSALAALVGAPVARQLAELAAPPARGPGRGRLPKPGSPAHRRAARIVQALGPVPTQEV